MFSELTELTHLDLSSNSIEAIDENMFQNNIKLERLYLGNNPIQRIDKNILTSLSNGASVDITLTNIKEFDTTSLRENVQFSGGFAVKTASGSYSQSYELNFLSDLKYVNISGNQLQNTSEVIQHFGSPIETLDASSNFIGKLTAETFRNLINLKYLNLQSTNLTTIDADTLNPLLFPESGRKLQVLLLNDNPITRLDSNVFLPMMNSVEVKVSCDHAEEIDTNAIANALKIDSNEREDIVFHVKSQNFELVCSKQQFKRLWYFNISGNQLKNGPQIIDWLGNSVETLDVSSNFVGKLNVHTFEKFTNLQQLNLSRTNLSNFGFATFYHQKNLRIFYLSFNQLKKVNFTLLFRNFQFLKTLRLEGNELTELRSVNREIFPSLSSLCISKNHFSCDYLATFLPKRHYTLLIYPINKTNIDGVDCVHEGEEISGAGKVESDTEIEKIPKNIPKTNFGDNNSTKLQRTTDINQIATIDQTTEMEDKPITRFDCTVLSKTINSQTVQVSCDHIKEIDTSCMGNSIQINFNNNDEIVFHLPQINSKLRCTKDNFQSMTFLNISGNQLQNASHVIALLGSAIETLDVSSNFIGTPNTQAFKRFTHLKYLNLS
ncbi:chaoptin-like, partial [Sitodiplosis mosellana]|uniref:chaoptin-like n=1 Tax=Sitodiplosis mosellana TaxID=263140 RepID=UPI002443C2EE